MFLVVCVFQFEILQVCTLRALGTVVQKAGFYEAHISSCLCMWELCFRDVLGSQKKQKSGRGMHLVEEKEFPEIIMF